MVPVERGMEGRAPARKVSELEDLLVHVRASLEPRPEFKVKKKMKLIESGPQLIFSTVIRYTGSYVMNDKICIMVEFDDRTVDEKLLDMSYGLIRRIIKDKVLKDVPVMDGSELRVHVTDTSSGSTDMEDDF
jgi:hypothetical protein